MKIFDFDYESEIIWTYSDSDKAIYRIDSKTSEVELVKTLGKYCNESFRGICCYNNCIYLAPQNSSKKILVYDLYRDTLSTKEIKSEYLPQGGLHNLFIEIVRYGSRLFFIPGRYEAIIILEQSTGEILYIDGWYSEIKDKILLKDNDLVIFNGVSKIDNDHIFINGWKVNASMILDLRTADYKLIEFEKSDKGVRGAALVGDKLVISLKTSFGVYLKNVYHKNFEKICNQQGRLYAYNNKIYIADSFAKSIYKMECADYCEVEKVYFCDKKIKSDSSFFLVKQYDNRLIILDLIDACFLIFDMELENVLNVDISKMISFSEKIQLYDKKVLVYENEYLNLEKFISALVTRDI